MKLSALLAPLIAAKVPHDQIMAVVMAFEAEQGNALEERRRADAERQARKRSRDVTLRHSDRLLTGEGVRVEDKTLTSEIEPQDKQESKKEPRERAFDAFWAIYPHKVGKADASKAFDRASRRVDLQTLMAGLRRYVAKTDDRPWCNPATWLNQDRWTDEPAAPMARAGPLRHANVALDTVDTLMEKLNAASSSETGPNPPYPRLVAFSGSG